MGSGSKRKKVKELFRGLFNEGDKGSMSDGLLAHSAGSDARRDGTIHITSSLLANDSPAVATVHAPSRSTLPTITARDSNNLSPSQVNRSLMTTPGGILNNASNFALHNPSFVDQSTTVHNHLQQPADAAMAMKQLSDRILPGATHDSSARDPPPRCHPDTRIRINEQIINWFYDAKKKEWLLWINGLAGVGKSAIIQTLAETLALAKHLGASVFISRTRQCNDSKRFFLTIAYQLAQHIEAYYTFITAKLARDPEVVNKGMKEQFRTFIVEPFVEKQIGAGGNPWAILVDGLDELDTREGQREIIRLVTSFVLEHPHTPLTWVIASRPEPHISASFRQEKIASSYAKEEVPIDSDEACKDVERYLNSSFETIRNKFPQIVPGEDWPSQRDVWRLARAASGLFAFAEFAIRFIGDMDYANPITRLSDVLLAIGRAKAGTFEEWPLAYLDALYTRILESISPRVWPTTQRVFKVLLFLEAGNAHWLWIQSLCDISLLLGIDLGIIYASFNNCSSVMKIPPREDASKRLVMFYHASFADYLLDSTRSGRFHISQENADEEVYSSLIRIWKLFQAQFPPGLDSEYFIRWHQFFRKYAFSITRNYLNIHLSSEISEVFDHILFKKYTKQEGYFKSDTDRDQCFDLLQQLDSSTLCQGRFVKKIRFMHWMFEIWTEFREELASRGIICEIPFEQLRLDHLDWPAPYPSSTYVKRDVRVETHGDHSYWQESCSREEDISGIKDFQRRCPQLPVLICGCPGKRFALLKDPKPLHGILDRLYPEQSICYEDYLRYYIIPYPDPQNIQQFLSAKFAVIRQNFPQTLPINWPTEADFRKLAEAASDQYAFASMAIRFIEDHNHANPVSRLDEILSIVDSHKGIPHNDEASHLDALYTHTLSLIPSTEWPTMKRVLGAVLYSERGSLRLQGVRFWGICEILGLDLDMVYVLILNYPFAKLLPEQSFADHETVAFYHTSFVDYLTDPARSKDFHISVESATEDVLWSIFGENSPSSREYARLPIDSNAIHNSKYRHYIPSVLLDLLITNHDPRQRGRPFVSQEDRDRCFELLGQLNASIVCAEIFEARHFRRFFAWVFNIWKMYQEELAERRIIREVEFAQLRFDHLDLEATLSYCTSTRSPRMVDYSMMSNGRVSHLESFQQSCPQLPVLICGSPGNRFALFEYQYTDADHALLDTWAKPSSGLYIIPYPDEM